MKRDEFIDIMSGIMEMYPGRFDGVGNFAMEMWYEALSDLDFVITKKALINHIKASKFPPTVADIREQYKLIIESNKKVHLIIEDLFKEMRDYFPGGSNDKEAEPCFMKIIVETDPERRLDKATKIKNMVIKYVRSCERGECNLNVSFKDCIAYIGGRVL